MEANLNLRMDKDTIEKAKKYAKEQGRSLSDLVENYLNAVVQEPVSNYEKLEITPYVQSLIEMGPKITLPADFDWKKDKEERLWNKYMGE